MKTLAIIGGGAAGLAAAVEAAREARLRSVEIEITVYEAADRVGKSILATGNGRCNLSNAAIDASVYRNAEFVDGTFRALLPADVQSFFSHLGLITREETEGRLYPLTNKASSVLDVLRLAAREGGVRESCGVEAIAVTPVQDRFLICFADDSTVFADAVVIACGGGVAQSMLPPVYLYEKTQPVLGPLRTDTAPIKGLNNVRVRCEVALYGRGAKAGAGACEVRSMQEEGWVREETDLEARDADELVAWRAASSALKAREEGEVLFRDYGVSGIAIFNLSRFAEEGDILSIDLVPGRGETELAADLASRVARFGSRSAVELVSGMLLAPVARAVFASIGVRPDDPLPAGGEAEAARGIKSFELEVRGIGDARQCQVSRGGFDVASFSPETMESRFHPGLHVAGEALDVDAPCGGYNLHWAWASGMLAGRSAAKRCGR